MKKNRGYQNPIVWDDAVGFYARRVMSYMAITPILHHSITPGTITSSFDKERMTAVYQRR
jgi:hypothetical protein